MAEEGHSFTVSREKEEEEGGIKEGREEEGVQGKNRQEANGW